ncbi:unnamed protein product [Sphagnum troendelagicum]|uniref:Long-chain-fatty-acid--CoA ligase n=1 Tax=Sphagnum troendelagicum TaxID=128251 RepID=A0ABP0UIF0_9BRYO
MANAERFIVKIEDAVKGRGEEPSLGPVYRSIIAKDGFPPVPDNMQTAWEIFTASVKRVPNNNLLGAREVTNGVAGKYIWQTYQQVYETVILIGSAMRHIGVEPKGRCGIYGANCPEWFIAMEACNAHSIVCVPLYDTLGAEAVEFIVNHAEVSIAFAQGTKLPLMIASLPKCTDHLKTIVSFTSVTSDQKTAAEAAGVVLYSWEEFLQLGKENSVDLTPPSRHDISTIMYTSGTTGEPKGVLLTHENVVTCINGLDHFLKARNEVMDENDVYFSFLPLAHIFDRVTEEFYVFVGGSIGFWQGDVKKIMEDLAELKPTVFVAVPRVFDRIYSGITSRVATTGAIRKWLFDFGFSMKMKSLLKGAKHDKAAPLFDKLLFNKVKMSLGGNVRLVISGAAPLPVHVEDFLRVVTCAPVVQGYGLTESCAASFIQVPNCISMQGTVGPPLPNIDVRLESVPELGYDALANPPRGEICIRGNTLFAGYYKREDLTREVLVDGWFHTGDVGEWQADGAMKIIDRKKNIFKLSQGEYVAVENLESIYGQCSAVDQIWVYGNSFEATLVAVAVPNQPALEKWAQTNGVEGDFSQLCKDPKAKEFILSELGATGKMKKVKGFEVIRGVYLDSLPFDLERNLVTPTFKLKRPQLLQFYKMEIDALYGNSKK